DIGVGDETAIWFSQRLGTKTRIVGCYANSGEGLKHYVDAANKIARERGWKLGDTFWPPDGRVREWGSGKSRTEQFHEYTGRLPRIVMQLSLDDGIAAARATLPSCEFDAGSCADGLRALKSYRKEWDEERGCGRDKPRHDWASHGADAFRVLATRIKHFELPPPKPIKPTSEPVLIANPDGSVSYAEPFSIFEWAEKRRRKRESDWA